MEARRTGAGNLQYAVWREGKHDDLVFAVALACWDAQRAYYRQTFGNREFMRRRDQEAWARKFREAMGEVKAGEHVVRETSSLDVPAMAHLPSAGTP